jgi:hypothetical protein
VDEKLATVRFRTRITCDTAMDRVRFVHAHGDPEISFSCHSIGVAEHEHCPTAPPVLNCRPHGRRNPPESDMRLATRSLIAISALAPFALHARAVDTQPPPFARVQTDDWSGEDEYNNGSFTRSIVLDVTGDGNLDVVVLDSNVVMLLSCPDRFASVQRGNTRANDVDVVPLGNPSLGADSFVGVIGAGLYVQSFDPVAHELGAPNYIATGNWCGAKFVRCAQLNGSGGLDFVGVASDKVSVIALFATSSGYESGSATITLQGNAKDLAVVDWDGDGDKEIAFRTVAGLEVWDVNGTSLLTIANATTAGALCTLPMQGATKQRLAWITTNGSNQELRILGDGVTTQVIDFGAGFGAAGMNAADHNLDGQADLYVTTTASHYVKVFRVDPSSNPFVSAMPSEQIPYQHELANSTPAPGMKTSPLVADFDHDGDADLVLPVDRTATGVTRHVETVRGAAIDETLFRSVLEELRIHSGIEDGESWLQFNAFIPTFSIGGLSPTHLDIRIWRQAWNESTQALDPIDPTGRLYRFAIAQDETTVVTLGLEGQTASEFNDAYRIIIEPVLVDGGVVTKHFPARITALAGSESTLNILRNDGEYWGEDYEQKALDEQDEGERDDGGIVDKPDIKPEEEGTDPGTGGPNTPPPPPPNP